MGDVESVYAQAVTALVNIETEDTAVVVLKFSSGALGIIEATTATRPKDLEGSISILGENGSVVIGGFAVNQMQTWSSRRTADDDRSCESSRSIRRTSTASATRRTTSTSSIASATKAPAGRRPGRAQSLELISAIYESIETGREVPLRFTPKLCRLGSRRPATAGSR